MPTRSVPPRFGGARARATAPLAASPPRSPPAPSTRAPAAPRRSSSARVRPQEAGSRPSIPLSAAPLTSNHLHSVGDTCRSGATQAHRAPRGTTAGATRRRRGGGPGPAARGAFRRDFAAVQIWTIGFTQSTAEHFFGRLAAARIGQLLDVRLSNSSQLAGFAKAQDLRTSCASSSAPCTGTSRSSRRPRSCSTARRSRRATGRCSSGGSSRCWPSGRSRHACPRPTSSRERRCSAARRARSAAIDGSSASTSPATGPGSPPCICEAGSGSAVAERGSRRSTSGRGVSRPFRPGSRRSLPRAAPRRPRRRRTVPRGSRGDAHRARSRRRRSVGPSRRSPARLSRRPREVGFEPGLRQQVASLGEVCDHVRRRRERRPFRSEMSSSVPKLRGTSGSRGNSSTLSTVMRPRDSRASAIARSSARRPPLDSSYPTRIRRTRTYCSIRRPRAASRDRRTIAAGCCAADPNHPYTSGRGGRRDRGHAPSTRRAPASGRLCRGASTRRVDPARGRPDVGRVPGGAPLVRPAGPRRARQRRRNGGGEALPAAATIDVGGVRIAIVHDPGRREGREERLAARFPDCAAVVYGHTHLPQIEQRGGVWILNPGSPTERRRGPFCSLLRLEVDGPELRPGLVRLP